MRKSVISVAAFTAMAFAGAAFANGNGAGIKGSPHDFTDNYSDEVGGFVPENQVNDASGNPALDPSGNVFGGWNGRHEICRVCHVPHDHSRAGQYYLNGLLWNHEVSTETFTMYDSAWSSSLDGTVSAAPDGPSKLCLSCHDGTVAIDSFDKYVPGTAGNEIQNIYAGAIGGYRVPGFAGDLRGTHPISITYDSTADIELHDETTTAMGPGVIEDYLDFGMAGATSTLGKVQCSSCHDVHDSPSESVAGTHLLRVLNNGTNPSGLCLTCHNK